MSKPTQDAAKKQSAALITARNILAQAGQAVVIAQAAQTDLPTDATDEQRAAAAEVLKNAQDKVTAAEAAVAELAKVKEPAPKPGRPTAQKPQPQQPQGSAAANASGEGALEVEPLFGAMARYGVRWQRQTFEAGERLRPDLPKKIYDELILADAIEPLE